MSRFAGRDVTNIAARGRPARRSHEDGAPLIHSIPMRPNRAALAVAALVLLLAVPALAAPAGFAFLEIPAGARNAALGGALATVSGGAEAMFANPSAIDPGKGIQVSAGHSELIQKLRHDYFSISGHAWGGGLGASLRALYSEPIEERDDVGNLIGTFGAHDLELAVGYGTKLAPELKIGFSAQVVRERISNQAATTYGFSAGTTWEPERWQNLRLGLAVQNVGPAAHYTIDGVQGEPVGLPMAVQGGVSYAVSTGGRMSLRGALETRVTRGRNGIGIAGAELSDVSGAALRFGMRVNDDASNFSAGAGYVVGGLRLDYAYVPFKLDLGETHRVSFTASF
jgi:hypothetical protein